MLETVNCILVVSLSRWEMPMERYIQAQEMELQLYFLWDAMNVLSKYIIICRMFFNFGINFMILKYSILAHIILLMYKDNILP